MAGTPNAGIPGGYSNCSRFTRLHPQIERIPEVFMIIFNRPGDAQGITYAKSLGSRDRISIQL